jgi:hypothetical protein
MAFNPSSMLLSLSPAGGLGNFAQDLQQMSAQRQQMRLAREKFEFDKKQSEEDKRLRMLEEQGRMAREKMQAEREREQAQAVKDAALLAKQQEHLGKFGELAGTGQTQQADAMSPLLDQLGYNTNNLGSVGGLPVYQLENRAQAAAEAAAVEQARAGGDEMAGLGYPTNERGTLDDTQASPSTLPDDPSMHSLGGEDPVLDEATADALMPGEGDYRYTPSPYAPDGGGAYGSMEEGAGHDMPEEEPAEVVVNAGGGLGVAQLSGQDPFARALAAGRQGRETGVPTRAPDEEDFMGAVPRNVIDLPAMNAQTLARLNPALQARIGALPEELRSGAEANAKAIGGLGYESKDALKEFDTAMEDPLSIYNKKLDLKAEEAKRIAPSLMEISTFRERGAKALTDFAKDRGVTGVLDAVNKADEVLRVIDDPTGENDRMIAPALMKAQGVDGVPSNTDLQFAFNAKSSLIGDIVAAVEEAIIPGLNTAQKKAIKDYLAAVKESQRRTVDDYLDNAFARYDSDELNEYEKKGYLGALEQSVPASWHNDYWKKREGREGKGARGGQSAPAGEAGKELQRQAEAAGLNGQVLGQLMGGESGGKTDAANENRTDGGPKSSAKGVFQLTNETARLMGFKDSADYSAQPLEKQIEVGLKLFKNKGLKADSPPEDYALVLAAPSFVGKWKSRDDVVYKKGSIEWEGNAPWRPAGGGDITVGSIADYYVGKGGAKPAEAKAEAKAAKTTELKMPEPKTPQEKRYLELLAKQKGG